MNKKNSNFRKFKLSHFSMVFLIFFFFNFLFQNSELALDVIGSGAGRGRSVGDPGSS